jgi:hypothetical protein
MSWFILEVIRESNEKIRIFRKLSKKIGKKRAYKLMYGGKTDERNANRPI